MLPAARGFFKVGTIFRILAVFAVVCAAAGSEVAAADPLRQGTASGFFSVDGKKVTLKYAYAMLQESMSSPDGLDVAVLLTSAPLGEEALKARTLDDAIDTRIPSLFYALDAGGKTVREALVHPARKGGGDTFTGLTLGAVTLKREPDRVQGTVGLSSTGENSQSFFHFAFAVKAEFKAPLSASGEPPRLTAANADPLPKDGGAPGKAYLALVDAARKGDLKALQPLVDPELLEGSAEEKKFTLAMLKEPISKAVKIDKGFVKGENATLYVVGTGADGVSYGTIRMQATGSAWILKQQFFGDRPGTR